jgi:hypothetical protein
LRGSDGLRTLKQGLCKIAQHIGLLFLRDCGTPHNSGSVAFRQTRFHERDADSVTRGPQRRNGKLRQIVGWQWFDYARHVCGGGAHCKSLVVSPELAT